MAIKNVLKREKEVDVETLVEMQGKTSGKRARRRHRKHHDPSMKIDWISPSRAFVSAVEFVPFSVGLGVACWGLAFATDKVVTLVLGMLG